ncbi:MAG: class I SAM-dependent methyltransferase [Chloroflexota bacterium]|nr:class I SAM-dependent methyltransferase [Chloroflexota bacterium]
MSKQLEAAIDPWLQHMRWRTDFSQWRERRLNQERYQAERLHQVERVAGPLHHRVILDLGAGMGGFAVAATLRGATVAACEFNRGYCLIIKLRAERNDIHLPVYNAVGEALPFAAASFDTVVSWDVIEHVRSPQEMLSELNRVLVPGGAALVTAINRWAWKDPHYHMRGLNWLPRPWAERIILRRGRSKLGAAFQDMQRLSEMHYFTYPAFVRLARRHGFRVHDLKEAELRRGTLHSPKTTRRFIRAILRALRLERPAYRLQRHWYVGMFELALVKER